MEFPHTVTDEYTFILVQTECRQTSKSNLISSLSNKIEHTVFFKQSVLSTQALILLIS